VPIDHLIVFEAVGESRVLRTRLRHAPLPLAASGLDMRIGHPAASRANRHPFSQARFSCLGAELDGAASA